MITHGVPVARATNVALLVDFSCSVAPLEDTMLLTMRTVDRILELAGLGTLPSNGAGPT